MRFLVLLVLCAFVEIGWADGNINKNRNQYDEQYRGQRSEIYGQKTPNKSPDRSSASRNPYIQAGNRAPVLHLAGSNGQQFINYPQQCVKTVTQDLKTQLNIAEQQVDRCLHPLPISNKPAVGDTDYPPDCLSILNSADPGAKPPSGSYIIYPGYNSKGVYCDMDTDGGGWTVIQRRGAQYDDEYDRTFFYITYQHYVDGFGDVNRDYWLGNDAISYITGLQPRTLRVELVPWKGPSVYEEYKTFSIAGADDKYRLTVAQASGTAGDSLGYTQLSQGNHVNSNGQQFSAYDEDNDNSTSNCAKLNGGAWWYDNCEYSNLNGIYSTSQDNDGFVPVIGSGISWGTAPGDANDNFSYSFRETWMKIR